MAACHRNCDNICTNNYSIHCWISLGWSRINTLFILMFFKENTLVFTDNSPASSETVCNLETQKIFSFTTNTDIVFTVHPFPLPDNKLFFPHQINFCCRSLGWPEGPQDINDNDLVRFYYGDHVLMTTAVRQWIGAICSHVGDNMGHIVLTIFHPHIKFCSNFTHGIIIKW